MRKVKSRKVQGESDKWWGGPKRGNHKVSVGMPLPESRTNLVDVSDIFYFFLCSGRGKGESEAPGGWGIGFLLKIPGGGGEAGRGRRAGRSAANRGIWGGGLNFFFRGRNVHQAMVGSKEHMGSTNLAPITPNDCKTLFLLNLPILCLTLATFRGATELLQPW